MEPISIILIVLGIVLLLGSCFFGKDDGKEPEYDELLNRLAKRELSAEETERIRQTVDQIISDKTEEVIIKTDADFVTASHPPPGLFRTESLLLPQ